MSHLRFTTALVLGLALTAVAPPARAEDGEKPAEKEKATEGPAPEVRYPPFSTRFKVLAAGLAITGTAWGISFGAARGWPEQTCVIDALGPAMPGTAGTINRVPCSSGPPGSNQLAIPIVGPWIALAKSGCPTDEPNCSIAKPIVRGVAYVIDGVVQLGGLGLIIESLVMKTESAADPAKKTSAFTLRYRGIEATPVPLVGPGATGLSLVGTF